MDTEREITVEEMATDPELRRIWLLQKKEKRRKLDAENRVITKEQRENGDMPASCSRALSAHSSIGKRQRRQSQEINLDDPDMEMAFQRWFPYNLKSGKVPDRLRYETVMRILREQFCFDDSQTDEERAGVSVHMAWQIRFAMDAAANLVKEDLIKVAQYAMQLEEEIKDLQRR